MQADRLSRDRFVIERNMAEDDWTGHSVEPDWQIVAGPVAAGILFMRGGEGVLASRLTAKQPAILTIRNSAAARGILPSDRAKNVRTGEMFNIREQPRVSRDNLGFLEMLIESGVTDG